MTAGRSPVELLDALDALRAKATPGVWRWDPEFGDEGDKGLALTNEDGAEIVGAYNWHCCSFRDDPTVSDADAACIVAEHNAMPALVAALRAVLELADGWRESGEKFDRLCDEARGRFDLSSELVYGLTASDLTEHADALRAAVAAALAPEGEQAE